ncbi:MAG: alpha-isopropylmalate synthase regulatory domain-containing protein, partial [Candidatus Methanomethylicaceae archaeon]
GVGIGPVDAAAKAIQSAIGEEVKLLNYKLEAISGGTDSLCSVEVVLEDKNGRIARGLAVGGDIVIASVNALLEGINKIYRMYKH